MSNNCDLKAILIFGSGSSGTRFYQANKNKYNVLGFIDNYCTSEDINGIPIFSPCEIHSLSFNKIVIASVYVVPIYEQLTNELNVKDEDILFFHPQINSLDEYKLLAPRPLKTLPQSLNDSEDNIELISSALVEVAKRFPSDFCNNNEKLLTLLQTQSPDDFYELWQEVTLELVFNIQYSDVFFSSLDPSIVHKNNQYQNRVWLPEQRFSPEYLRWLELRKSTTQRDLIVWPLLIKMISQDYFQTDESTDISILFFFRDILYGHFVCPEYKELQKEIHSICYKQRQNWAAPYCNSYPYQGLDEIGIGGLKPTEKRLELYNLDDILTSEKVVLDIGSNCGFLGTKIAKKVKHVDMVEFNPFLTSVTSIMVNAFKLENVNNILEDFTFFVPNKKYDVVLSLANHCTIDGNLNINFEEYIAKCFCCLKLNGYLIFESHNIYGKGEGEMGDDSDLNEKFDIVEKYFTVIKDKMTRKFVPLHDVDKLIVILQRRPQYLPKATRTFDLATSKRKYTY